MVTLYGINKYNQVFKSFVVPDEVDFYIKEKGLTKTRPVIKDEKAIEVPVEKEVVVVEVVEKIEKKKKYKKAE